MKVIILLVIIVLLVFWLRAKPRGFCNTEDPWDYPFVVDDIISRDECNKIIQMVDAKFVRSTVLADTPIESSRTSETTWISKSDPAVEKLVRKASELTGLPAENMENVQVVRYKPGTYYKPHHDSCCTDTRQCLNFGSQRVGTLLVYLNDDFTEGHTEFPNINLKLRAKPGSAIFFRPLGESGKCHPKSLHAGLPVGQGVKYVCNVWVREGPF